MTTNRCTCVDTVCLNIDVLIVSYLPVLLLWALLCRTSKVEVEWCLLRGRAEPMLMPCLLEGSWPALVIWCCIWFGTLVLLWWMMGELMLWWALTDALVIWLRWIDALVVWTGLLLLLLFVMTDESTVVVRCKDLWCWLIGCILSWPPLSTL